MSCLKLVLLNHFGENMLKKTGNNNVFEAKKSASHNDAKAPAAKLHGSLNRAQISQSEPSLQNTTKKRNAFCYTVYENAAQIYLHLKGEVSTSQLPKFDDDLERRRAYSLAFGAKRYESVLDDILLDSYFFSSYFRLEAYHKHRVMVMLLDYQQNGFYFGSERRSKSSNIDEEGVIPHVREIQQAMISHRTKLRAALARSRIRDCAISVEALLPKEEQEKIQHAAAQPVYARINALKGAGCGEILETLKQEGFVLVSSVPEGEEMLTGRNFMKDEHFHDLLVFSQEIKLDLYGNDLVRNGQLTIQDKSTIAVVEGVKVYVDEISRQKEKASSVIPGGDMLDLLKEGDDIIQTHAESGNMTAHLAAIIHPERKVLAFGVTPDRFDMLEENMKKMGAMNVDLLQENFLDSLPNDERFRRVKIVVVNVPCSKSGIVNPVDFVLQEGITTSIKELARGNVDSAKIKGLAFQHQRILRHAMNFPLLQGIVYVTRSSYPIENENVVQRSIDEHREDHARDSTFFSLAPVLPDVAQSLRMCGKVVTVEDMSLTQKGSEQTYLTLEPSSAMNGGFIALLKRQKPIEMPKDVLKRAAKKGLVKSKAPKPARISSPKGRVGSAAKTRPPPAFLSVVSDNEAEPNLKIPDKKRQPRNWQGSAEELAKAEVKTKAAPKKKEKAKPGFSQYDRFVLQ